jgi:hypothetical protein
MKRMMLLFTAMLSLAPFAQGQFGSGVVYDPTQSAHAIQQIEQGQNIFTNSVKLADSAIATYNLAHQMAISPQSLYQPFMSFSSVWMMVNQAANTYGNSQQWTNSVNTGTGATYGYQQATIPRTGQISGYGNLSTPAQQQIAAQGATADLNDSVTSTNMQTLGTIRANSQQRQTDISALISASQTADPAQHTEMATLQRINQALILLIQQQQEDALVRPSAGVADTTVDADALQSRLPLFPLRCANGHRASFLPCENAPPRRSRCGRAAPSLASPDAPLAASGVRAASRLRES